MCEIVTWLNNYFPSKNDTRLPDICIITSEIFCEMDPCTCIEFPIVTVFNEYASMYCCLLRSVRLFINSSPPSASYMRQWIGPALVQIMACRLFGAKPLSKQMLGYCQLDP